MSKRYTITIWMEDEPSPERQDAFRLAWELALLHLCGCDAEPDQQCLLLAVTEVGWEEIDDVD